MQFLISILYQLDALTVTIRENQTKSAFNDLSFLFHITKDMELGMGPGLFHLGLAVSSDAQVSAAFPLCSPQWVSFF